MIKLSASIIHLLCASFALSLTVSAHADLQGQITTEAATARKILDSWHSQNPQPSARTLHIVYWSPSDRQPAPAYRERLTRIFDDIQKFYADEMQRIGFGPRTIQLDRSAEKLLRVHLVQGKGTYADYGMDDGSKIRTECLPTLREAGIDPDRETVVIFCNMANWDEKELRFTHKSPYYAGGNAGHGTAWQLDSPELDTKNLPLKKPIITDGQYGRISLGKHNSIFIGGITHELGHALGLPHNLERADERAAFGTALMGSGNRSYGDQLRGEGKGSFLTLAHAMRLASHPQFSGSIRGLYTPARAKFSDFRITSADKSFSVSGIVKSAVPIYAVVAYMDPDGGGDYNSTTTTTVPSPDGKFTLNCAALANNKTGVLRIVACLANGATQQHRFSYKVDAAGKPDLSGIQLKLALASIVAGIRDGDPDLAKKIASLENPRAIEIARRLATPTERKLTPAQIDTEQIPLSDTKPTSAKVGWMRPTYNRLPGQDPLLESGGEIFPTGIYAHAPAEHRYDLGGSWKRLTGQCGIAANGSGSVVFVITADGNEKWRSPATKPGKLHRYEIDISGTQELRLTAQDAGDSNRSDWGVWLEPTLSK